MDQQPLFLTILGLIAGFFILRLFFKGGSRVNPEEAAKRVAAGSAVLIDVRDPSEWAEGVAKPAVLLSLGDLQGSREEWKPFLEKNRGKELILYCASGMRSGMAVWTLKKEGYPATNSAVSTAGFQLACRCGTLDARPPQQWMLSPRRW